MSAASFLAYVGQSTAQPVSCRQRRPCRFVTAPVCFCPRYGQAASDRMVGHHGPARRRIDPLRKGTTYVEEHRLGYNDHSSNGSRDLDGYRLRASAAASIAWMFLKTALDRAVRLGRRQAGVCVLVQLAVLEPSLSAVGRRPGPIPGRSRSPCRRIYRPFVKRPLSSKCLEST